MNSDDGAVAVQTTFFSGVTRDFLLEDRKVLIVAAPTRARFRVHLLNRLRFAQLKREEIAKNRLLCMAAHDLRNPLVSIRALTNIIRTGDFDRRDPRYRDGEDRDGGGAD